MMGSGEYDRGMVDQMMEEENGQVLNFRIAAKGKCAKGPAGVLHKTACVTVCKFCDE